MAEQDSKPQIRFSAALSVMLFLMAAISTQVFILDSSSTTQITLLIVVAFAAMVALLSGFRWDDIQKGILYGCHLAMLPMLILMLVGVLIASWVASGTIPAMIYYGMKILSPEYFLFSACLVCCIGSISTGSSWTTAATFGVGFMGIGIGLQIDPAITAGAVISGSIFGDKMSPLSDSTNLAAGVAEADLFDHIKSMVYSTGPAIVLTLISFFIIGLVFQQAGDVDESRITLLTNAIRDNYSLNLVTLLPPVLVVYLAMKKVSGLAVMVVASMTGALIAIFLQGNNMHDMLEFMNYGYQSSVGIPEIDSVLSRGGLQNMMWTISLGFVALAMGGLFEKTGMLEVLLQRMNALVKSVKGLVTVHVFSSIMMNLFSAAQFLAIIIPGRMLVPVYRKHKLLPQVCSRVCEDSATVTSPLIPWGLGGVYYTSVLSVATLDYLPYTLFAFFAPMMTLLLAYTNKYMFREGDIPSIKTYANDDNNDNTQRHSV